MKLPVTLRFLRAFTRTVRPVRASLDSIATSLAVIARIQQFRLAQEGMVIPDENIQRHPGKDDMTEISYKVEEPPPSSDADIADSVDLESFFRP